jgi:hypothetical protein
VNWTIIPGDVRESLATLLDGSVQTCVTSPPYYDAAAISETALQTGGGEKANAYTAGRNGALPRGKWSGGKSTLTLKALHESRNKRSVWHVATQPEKLIEPCILAGSRIGDTVLDPFCGSGTTGAVAIRHQRNFIGCELNPEYIRIAERRIGGVAPLFTVAGAGISDEPPRSGGLFSEETL